MTEALNVIIAGFGWWGQTMLRKATHSRETSVLGIMDPATAARERIAATGLKAYADLDEALSEPELEAVILTTPNAFHEEQVRQVAAAGKHVFCEKPVGLSGASAQRSVDACRKAGVVLGVGHERRFEPAMLDLKEQIGAGEFGTIMHAEAAFSHDKLVHVPAADWRTAKATAPAAGMTGMGIHLTDLFISFFGKVETVQAMTASRSLNWETGDVVTAQLGFAEGMTATLSSILHTPQFIRMHVFGTKKWIQIINESHPDASDGVVRVVTSAAGSDPVESTVAWADSVLANLEAFARACRKDALYPFTDEEIVHNVEVLEAIAASSEGRATVTIGH